MGSFIFNGGFILVSDYVRIRMEVTQIGAIFNKQHSQIYCTRGGGGARVAQTYPSRSLSLANKLRPVCAHRAGLL